MNKKAQLDNPMIGFAMFVIILIIVAPFVLLVMTSFSSSFSSSLGNLTASGSTEAKEAFDEVTNTGIQFMDGFIMIMFLIAVILLFVSSFLVDAHPIFIFLYIITNMLLMFFAPSIMLAADKIYENSLFSSSVAQLTMLDFIRTNYAVILVGLMVVTGIIIYGKISLGGNARIR